MKKIMGAVFSLFFISTLCISCSMSPPSDELIFKDMEEYMKGYKGGRILDKTVKGDKAQILIGFSSGESEMRTKFNYLKYNAGWQYINKQEVSKAY
jgi:hypothetical protein